MTRSELIEFLKKARDVEGNCLHPIEILEPIGNQEDGEGGFIPLYNCALCWSTVSGARTPDSSTATL